MWGKSAVLIIVSVATVAMGQGVGPRRPSKKPLLPQPNFSMEVPTIVNGEGTTTASGLTYWDIKTGTGAPATKGKAVKVHYTGWLESGRKFDSSVNLGQPFIFVLGSGHVIKGWDEGVEGMRVGGKRQLRVPPKLAYGGAGVAGDNPIPPNATLTFDIEVVGVQ